MNTLILIVSHVIAFELGAVVCYFVLRNNPNLRKKLDAHVKLHDVD